MERTNDIEQLLSQFLNRIPSHVIITRPNMIDPSDESFQDQKSKLTPLSKTYKEGLKEIVLSDEELSQKISCYICQDTIFKDEKIIKLDCNDQPHYFHSGENKEECPGILPWFELNNTCPMCRTEFPPEPEPDSETNEPEPEPDSETNEPVVPEPDSETNESVVPGTNEQGPPPPTTNTELTLDQIDGLQNNHMIIPIHLPLNNIFQNIIQGNEVAINDEEAENNQVPPPQNIIRGTLINNIMREIREQMEEDELQATILRSIEET